MFKRTWQIKGMKERTIAAMKLFILKKYGKTRRKDSILAEELDIAIMDYIEKDAHAHTQGTETAESPGEKKLQNIAQELQTRKEAQGALYYADLWEAIGIHAGYDKRTQVHYKKLLRQRGYIKDKEDRLNPLELLRAVPQMPRPKPPKRPEPDRKGFA